jgi:hypothetical protein
MPAVFYSRQDGVGSHYHQEQQCRLRHIFQPDVFRTYTVVISIILLSIMHLMKSLIALL